MQLKPWMKVLCWLGLGLGTGFFAGYQVGCRMERKGFEQNAGDSSERTLPDDYYNDRETERQAKEALREYAGDTDGNDQDIPVEVDLSDPNLSRELAIDEENVSGLPYPITEEEFNQNEYGYEIKTLDYYEGDEVLHDPEHDVVLTDQERDNMLGANALNGFGGDPNNPTEVLYICNEMNGTLYYVELLHGDFNDTTEYANAPQEEPGEEREEVYPEYEVDEDEEQNW